MTSNEKILELIARHVLPEGEQVVRVKHWPDGVAVTTTALWHLVAGSESAAWTISQEPWVDDVVIAERDDLIVEGQSERFGFLLLTDGTDIYLNDPTGVSELGRRLAHGMDPSAYAEILIGFHPYTSAYCTLLHSSDDLQRVTGLTDMYDIEPVRLQRAPNGVRLTFSSLARYRLMGQDRGDLLAWTVEVPAGEPARWTSHPTATGLRLVPADDEPISPDGAVETNARAMPEGLPPEVADVLRAAGWSPDRRQTDAQVAAAVGVVEAAVGRNGATIESFPAAVDAVTEFGGIAVLLDGPGRDLRRRSFVIDPAQVAATAETLADLGKRLRTRLFPIGAEGHSESVLAIDEAGRIFALDHAGNWFLGDSPAAAFATLVTGTQPPRLDETGNWLRDHLPGIVAGMEQVGWRAPVITRDEAEVIAEKWVNESAPAGVSFTVVLHEFDVGYVVSADPQPGSAPVFGTGLGILDKFTGERSTWPGLPVQRIIDRYRARRSARPQTVWTWNPAERARWDLRHVATPSTVTHLQLADRQLMARSVKGDEPPGHHRLVSEFMQGELDAANRERGYERCSEAAAISDALHAEDARRPLIVAPPITLAEARAELFANASMVTYRVREPGDPAAGAAAPPCWSCAALVRYFGLTVRPPRDSGTGETTRTSA